MKLLKAVIALELMIGLTLLLAIRLKNIPALGDLLNPSTGFWNNSELRELPQNEVLGLGETEQAVTVRYDRYRVPHIFASSDHDIYFAQGFVTARDRLWQMDMQARTAGGRVAEVLGADFLNQDRYYRRIGLSYAAERSLETVMKDSVMRRVLEAYTEGVNAYIRGLRPSNYPLEYKLFGYSPEAWKPINCILIFKLMGENLSSGSTDFKMSANLKRFGVDVTRDLFPDHPFLAEPVVPAGTRWDFAPLKAPDTPMHLLAGNYNATDPRPRPDGIGSNNWVVAGNRSANGFPLLVNDPHLNLSLPSVWYQLQLTGPGVNVYGVTIPGIPCVIIGYNDRIAWGMTNSGADIQDWYRIRFDNDSKTQYWYNGRWNAVTRRVETIKIRGKRSLTDTIGYTHQGPIARQAGPWDKVDDESLPVAYALRWIVHEGSEDLRTFYLLNRSRDYKDYREALNFFCSPPQNFVFASSDRDIAITASGKYPLRYSDQGKFLLDGSAPENDWQGWIPFEQDPAAKNPACGFLSSANQPATDPTYPYYISWQYGSSERARRINSRLSAMMGATADSLRILQNDTYSTLAAEVLPSLLKEISRPQSAAYAAALDTLNGWSYRYDRGSTGATLFNLWWEVLYKSIWEDEFDRKDVQLLWPSRERTEKLLLEDKEAVWYDNVKTPQKETRALIINQSFVKAVDSLTARFGPPGKKWQWGRTRNLHISHLSGIDALGTGSYIADGAPNTIDALAENFGPSWRMVVQLGPVIKGYGVFPGGESGNPGSRYYDNFFDTWKNGQLNELIFLHTKDEQPSDILFSLTLK